MLRKFQFAGLVTVVASALLLPLYGDPRNAAVTHPEWARMVLRALDMDDGLPDGASASQAFAILSWKNTLSYRADRFVKGENVDVVATTDGRRAVATGVAELVYPLAVVRKGDYRVRLRMQGDPNRPASVELARPGEVKPVKTFAVVPSTIVGWVEAGVTHLDSGPYLASVLMPTGAALEQVEVAPPCIAPIEPIGGWRATAPLMTDDVAVTGVKALDKESELPPAEMPIDVSADTFQAETTATSVAQSGPVAGLEGLWLRAGPGGTRAVVFIELPRPGLYTISVFGIDGEGQSWLADSCRKSVVCAGRDGSDPTVAQWRVLMTAQFTAGRHFFTVILGRGAAVQRLRAERKKEAAADYVDTFRRIGFDVGEVDVPMPRARAVAAMEFLKGRRVDVQRNECGDFVLPEVPALPTGLQVAQVPGPQTPITAGPPPFGPGGGGPPGLPLPQPPGPPIVVESPPVTTPPTTTPPVTTPTPTPPPPPTTVPVVPSPVPSLPPPPTLPSPPVPTPVLPASPSPSPGP